jgi:hypothetical protein
MHSWLGLALLLATGGGLFMVSAASGKLALQYRAVLHLAARPMVFWPVFAFIAAGRLALLWAIFGGKPPLG